MADKGNTAVTYRGTLKDDTAKSLGSGTGEDRHRTDEEIANDPLAAPLKRQLKSRHLQMIAIGGTTRAHMRPQFIFLEVLADFLHRHHRPRVTGQFGQCAARGWARRGSYQLFACGNHRLLRDVIGAHLLVLEGC